MFQCDGKITLGFCRNLIVISDESGGGSERRSYMLICWKIF